MADRHFCVIFADDLRQEIDGKVTIVGAYQSQMIFAQLPAVLPKLAVLMIASTPVGQPFKKLVFEIYKDDELIHSMDFESEIPEVPEFQMAAVLSPLNIDEPCVLRSVLVTENGKIEGRSLQITEVAKLH